MQYDCSKICSTIAVLFSGPVKAGLFLLPWTRSGETGPPEALEEIQAAGAGPEPAAG